MTDRSNKRVTYVISKSLLNNVDWVIFVRAALQYIHLIVNLKNLTVESEFNDETGNF